jgi:peptidylprolyl isomerase
MSETIVTTDSGLQYVDLVVGDGDLPEVGSLVEVHYTGTLEDGTVFDSSHRRNKTFEFNVGEGLVIAGWDEGLMSMRIGGKRKLIIPAELGYGANGIPGVIPGESTLIFEVDLISIN